MKLQETTKKDKKVQKTTNKLIILTILLSIVFSFVVPNYKVYAWLEDTEKQIIQELDDETKKQIDEDELDEFIDIFNDNDRPLIKHEEDPNDRHKLVPNEEYKNWVKNTLIPNYLQYYKPFNNENGENKYYTGNKGGEGSTGYKNQVAYKNYIEEKRAKFNDYAKSHGASDENLGKNNQENKQEDQAELERIEGIIGRKDEGLNYLGPAFQTICKFVVAIGDTVVNTLQNYMLEGSPTAVNVRDNTDEMKDILKQRNEDYPVIVFNYINRSTPGARFVDEFETIDEQEVPVPFIYYSPLAIFSNRIPAMDINFINEETQIKNPFIIDENGNNIVEQSKQLIDLTETETKREQKGMAANITKNTEKADEKKAQLDAISQEYAQGKNTSNTARTLQKTIQKWYIALRNIAIIGLLIVLVYIGIRILISVTAEEQAKYKKIIKNWVMALVLIAVLHYIMLGLITIVRIVCQIFTQTVSFVDKVKGGDEIMNTIRMEINRFSRTQQWVDMMGYTVLYATLVWYLVIFTFKFIKRVVYMAFLTVIAPMVALTYPIDKMKDGKSQAYNLWLKEYAFNLIIQPVDLLMYVVLVVSAQELVDINFLYAIVAIGFILQGEKIVKKMFGLEPKMTEGSGGFTAGAAFSTLMTTMQQGTGNVTNALQGENDEQDSKQSKIRLADGRTADSDKKGILSAFGKEEPQEMIEQQIEQEKQKEEQQKQQEIEQNEEKTNKAKIKIPLLNISKSNAKHGIEQQEIPSPTQTRQIKKEIQNTMRRGGTVEIPKLKIKNNPYNSVEQVINKKGPASRVTRTIGGLTRHYLNMDTAKKAAKLTAMGLGAGTFGLLGVAAGLASDDFSNVVKMGAIGAGGGAALGGELAKQTGTLVNKGKDGKEAFQKAYYGNKYNDIIKNPELDRKWYYSENTRNYFITHYGDNWKEKRDEAMELRKQGITDEKDMKRAIKLKDDSNKGGQKGFTIQEAGDIINFANGVTSRKELMTKDGEQKVYNQILSIVKGDTSKADRIMKGVKEVLNLPTDLHRPEGLQQLQQERKEKLRPEYSGETREDKIEKEIEKPKIRTQDMEPEKFENPISNEEMENQIRKELIENSENEKEEALQNEDTQTNTKTDEINNDTNV